MKKSESNLGKTLLKSLLIYLVVFLGLAGSVLSLKAQEKQTAVLGPMGSLGDFTEIENRLIFNTLQEALSIHYQLASNKMYEEAEEEAFQQITAEECTEDQCIAIIQELLQTEYFFIFETKPQSITMASLSNLTLIT